MTQANQTATENPAAGPRLVLENSGVVVTRIG